MPAKYFEVADSDRTYFEKLTGYAELSESYLQTERYAEFCATALPDLDDIVRDWVTSADFDALLVDTVRATYPQAEHERFLATPVACSVSGAATIPRRCQLPQDLSAQVAVQLHL